MSRTKRNIYESNRHWVNRVDINPLTLEPYPDRQKWVNSKAKYRRGQDGHNVTGLCVSGQYDALGSFIMSGWTVVWGRNGARRSTNKLQRQANKNAIRYGLNDHYHQHLDDQDIDDFLCIGSDEYEETLFWNTYEDDDWMYGSL